MTTEGYEGTSGPSGQIRSRPLAGFRVLICRNEPLLGILVEVPYPSITPDGWPLPFDGAIGLFWNEADGRGIMASMLHGTKNASAG